MRWITLSLLLACSTIGPRCLAQSADLEKGMRAWCSQTGTWTGSINVTAADGKT